MEVRAILRTLLEALVSMPSQGSVDRGVRDKSHRTRQLKDTSFSLFSRTLQSGEAVWVMASFMSSLTLYRGQTQLTNSAIV